MNQQALLKKLGATLNRLRIPYLITGGLAVVVWGRPRFTADIDVVIELGNHSPASLIRELKKLGKSVYLDVDPKQRNLRPGTSFNLVHPDSGLRVDFWTLADDAFDRSRMKRRVRKVVGGVPLFFSSAEDLILIKLLWFKKNGSTRQLEDVASIIHIQKRLDKKYLQTWASELDIEQELKSALSKIKK